MIFTASTTPFKSGEPGSGRSGRTCELTTTTSKDSVPLMRRGGLEAALVDFQEPQSDYYKDIMGDLRRVLTASENPHKNTQLTSIKAA